MKTLLQYFFLLFLFNISTITTTCANTTIPSFHRHCIQHQQLLLLNFKKTLTFEYDPFFPPTLPSKFISWNSSTDCCSWLGVTCSTNGHVVGLDISSQSISGGIDNSSSLFDLQQLQSLNLAHNVLFNGTSTPSAIGKLTNLRYLNLSYINYYYDGEGKIPVEISQLTRLVVLDISQVSSESPSLSMLLRNLTDLAELYLDGVNISAPFPRFFANFSKLTSLSLSRCSLQGTFPKEIFQVPTLKIIDLSGNEELHGSLPEFPNNGSLRSLDLSSTNFSGSLPSSIENLKLLETIDLFNCSFTGSIPKSMENLTQLVHLDMYSNLFNGPISSIHWENLINLAVLDLADNLLEGSIPRSIFSLSLLAELALSDNRFSGQLSEFSNASSNLFYLDLSFNNLEGPIPVSIFNFRGLQDLHLSSNNFSAFPFNGPQHLKNLSFIDLSYNSLLILYNGTNSSYSSFPQIEILDLASTKLREIPGFLRYQSKLSNLDLSKNHIQGEIPHWIWSFKHLFSLNLSCNSLVTLGAPFNTSTVSVLDLHSNQLEGEIPYTLPNAVYLDYSSNHFCCSIPADIGNFISGNTKFLSLSNNNLRGIIPASICNGDLYFLDLSNNSLSGRVPRCLVTKDLEVLNLRRNNLTGTISNFEFSESCGLDTLDLGENRIKGELPKSLANCKSLQFLNLGNNQMKDAFPCLLKKISTLRVLALRSNTFYGGIACPKTNGTWPMLQIIDLAHNNLSGEIPRRFLTTWLAMRANEDESLTEANLVEYSATLKYAVYSRDVSFHDGITITGKGLNMSIIKILTTLTSVDFSFNNLSGPIPKEMGEFNSLHFLNLSGNSFTGKIPSSFGNMHQLESLDLSQNKLSGQIPPQLANLTFLEFLDLSNNQLVGKIPTGTQILTFPKESFMGNKGLWGPPLTTDKKARLSPPQANGNHPNSRYEIDWDLISVEIGFAFGFAVAVGSLVLCKRWSKWYYRAMYKILVKIFPQLEERIGPHRRHVHINQRW